MSAGFGKIYIQAVQKNNKCDPLETSFRCGDGPRGMGEPHNEGIPKHELCEVNNMAQERLKVVSTRQELGNITENGYQGMAPVG